MKEFQYTDAQKRALALLGGPAANVMLFGGSRSGKTFVLCCALAVRAVRAPASRHAIIRRHFNGVRTAIGMDTMPKVLRCRFPQLKVQFNRSESFFTFPNGSEIWLIGLDDAQRAEKILGKEFATIYFNECSELDYSSCQTALTRLAQAAPPLRNRAYYDCNPPGKSHWTYRVFIEKLNPLERTALLMPDNYAAMQINPAENRANLAPGYLEDTLAALPLAQRRRFLDGCFSDETQDALWSRRLIDSARVVNAPAELARIVIGVDPAVTGNSGSDMTGIVAAASGSDGDFYILADRSCRGNPLVWGHEVVELYRELNADRVIGEVNNGGELIEVLLRQLEPALSYRAVRAAHGKIVRAEPVAALYEKHLVHHVGVFPELEEEMCSFSPALAVHSPDRMDALVWAVTALMEPGSRFVLA